MKGFSLFAALAALAVCVCVCAIPEEAYAQRNQCNVQSSNQVSSAAAIQNQAVVDQLARLQAQVAQQAAAPRVSTATASSGSVAERRALSAPVSAPIVATNPATVSAVANSNGSSNVRARREGPIQRRLADSVAVTKTRRSGRTVSVAVAR